MSTIRQKIAAILLGVSATTAWANEVYIEQAGDATTINVTQAGSGNIVNGNQGSTDNAIVGGNGIALDITQTGDSNEAVVKLSLAASANIDYTVTGSSNLFDIYVNGGSTNTGTVDVTGDYNRVTLCGTGDGTASAVSPSTSGPLCSTGMSSNNITNTVTIDGDSNVVNVAAGGAGIGSTTNTINIGGNVSGSSSNIVNVTQTGTETHTVNLAVDGNTNVINITQGD